MKQEITDALKCVNGECPHNPQLDADLCARSRGVLAKEVMRVDNELYTALKTHGVGVDLVWVKGDGGSAAITATVVATLEKLCEDSRDLVKARQENEDRHAYGLKKFEENVRLRGLRSIAADTIDRLTGDVYDRMTERNLVRRVAGIYIGALNALRTTKTADTDAFTEATSNLDKAEKDLTDVLAGKPITPQPDAEAPAVPA